MGNETLDEAVLRRVEECVKTAKVPCRAPGRLGHRGCFLAAFETVEAFAVVTDAQHSRQRDEARHGQYRSPCRHCDSGEERRIHEQVELRVEITPERGDAPGETRELAVGVVENGLQLNESRRKQE